MQCATPSAAANVVEISIGLARSLVALYPRFHELAIPSFGLFVYCFRWCPSAVELVLIFQAILLHLRCPKGRIR